jgi:hypothetical protein
MMFSRRLKAGCFMTLLIAFCLGIGFVFGVLAHQTWKKKTEDPIFMKWAAMKHLERLQPTAEQIPKLEAKVDATLHELVTYKDSAVRSIWDTLERASNEIETELTQEQKEEWKRIRPMRPVDLK